MMNKTNPPQRPKRAQRSDGRSTRAVVLEAAGKVFAERGFAEATSKEICERAGTNGAAVNYYFDTLAAAASNYVLNPDHDNKAGIDVTAQRNAWIGSGKAEAADWDDATVMATPFKRMVYLSGDVQILGCMGGLEFAVTLM